MTDHLGSVTDLVDMANSAVVEHREYDAFGALDAAFGEQGQALTAANLKTPFGFTGQVHDAQTGLSYHAARWYDPGTGRFTSEDPIGEGTNHYRYAGNDPVNFYDPTGLSQAGNPVNALAGRNASAGRNIIPVGNFNNTNSFAGPSTNLRDFAFGSSYNVGAGTNSFVNHGATLGPQSFARPTTATSPSLLSQVGSGLSTAATVAKNFGRDYVSYLGTEVSTAGQRIVDNGRRAGTAAGDLVSGLYYDPQGKINEIGTSVYNVGAGLQSAASYAYNNPGAALSGIGNATVNYLDRLTSDPTVSGNLFGDFATSFATGGATAAGKQALGSSLNALSRFTSSFNTVESAVPDDLLDIINPSFIPNGRTIVSATAQQQADRGLGQLIGSLSRPQKEAYFRNPAAGAKYLGTKVHNETSLVLKEAYGTRFTYNPSYGPDFFDATTGSYIELTTPGQVARHAAKGGLYNNVEYATYVLP